MLLKFISYLYGEDYNLMSQICNQIFSILCLSVLFFLFNGRWGSGFHPWILSNSWIPGSKKVFVNYARGDPQRSKCMIRQYCDRPVRHVIGKHAYIISETKGPEFPVFKWKPTGSRQGGSEGTQIGTWGTDGLLDKSCSNKNTWPVFQATLL